MFFIYIYTYHTICLTYGYTHTYNVLMCSRMAQKEQHVAPAHRSGGAKLHLLHCREEQIIVAPARSKVQNVAPAIVVRKIEASMCRLPLIKAFLW